MQITYKYRLNPTPAQRTLLDGALEICRWVYNKTLGVRKESYEQSGVSLSLYDTNKLLTGWKIEEPKFKLVHSQVLQNVQERVDLAYQAFFRRVKTGEDPGFPRFKGKGWYDSFTFKQSGFKLEEERLFVSKIGSVKIKLHRPITGNVRTLTIRRDVAGNWYACFACEVDPNKLEPSVDVVGVDMGLTHFATLSNGEQIDNPRFFRRDENELAKVQRRLAKCDKGTVEYKRFKRRIGHIHQRIANRRKDFAHKLSRNLVNRFQIVAFEKLDIKELSEKSTTGMSKSIADAAWRQTITYTTYKAESAGRVAVDVNPRGTSQDCSDCGKTVKKDLSVRVHKCPYCGLVLDRDVNAARNILARGLARMGIQSLEAHPFQGWE